MITINFHPETDIPEFEKAALEYSEIWQKQGKEIFDTIERVSGLRFKTKLINAVTFEGISYSEPLRLISSSTYSQKQGTLIHELCHRLLRDNHFYIFDTTNLPEDVHKIIYLILYDIWVSVLGEETALENKSKEISYNDPSYKNAWDWALSFDKEIRHLKFKEMTKKYSNHPKAISASHRH